MLRLGMVPASGFSIVHPWITFIVRLLQIEEDISSCKHCTMYFISYFQFCVLLPSRFETIHRSGSFCQF